MILCVIYLVITSTSFHLYKLLKFNNQVRLSFVKDAQKVTKKLFYKNIKTCTLVMF